MAGHGQSGVGIFAQLVAQGADRDAQNVGGMGAVAQAMVQRVQDQIALDIRNRAADQAARHGGGIGHCALHRRILRCHGGGHAGADMAAIGQADGFRGYFRTLRQQHGAVNGVFQFAHIAAPGVAQQQPLGDRGDGAIRHAIGFGIFAGEMMRQSANVLGPFAQGRNAQIDDIQAIQKVFAEGAVLDRFGQVPVGGGDDADIHLDRLGAADPVDFAFLNGAQQLGLQARIHFADFVQQQGAAIGFFKLANAPGNGAGKGAFLMAEQFGFQQIFRDGGAIDRNERLVVAQRFAMDIARQHFFTRAAFARHQDRSFAARNLVGQRQHSRHGFVFMHQLMRFIGHGGEHGGDQFRIGGQGQIFLGAGADRVHGAARVRADAAGDHRGADAFRRQALDQGADVQGHVAEHQIGARPTAQTVQRLLDRDGVGDFCAPVHGDLGRRADLAVQSTDNE